MIKPRRILTQYATTTVCYASLEKLKHYLQCAYSHEVFNYKRKTSHAEVQNTLKLDENKHETYAMKRCLVDYLSIYPSIDNTSKDSHLAVEW